MFFKVNLWASWFAGGHSQSLTHLAMLPWIINRAYERGDGLVGIDKTGVSHYVRLTSFDKFVQLENDRTHDRSFRLGQLVEPRGHEQLAAACSR